MKILIACEYSGVVRDEFIKLGHQAVSCDLLPSESTLGPHYQGDVLDILYDGWDLMVAHPPCTYLCSSGLHWNKRVPGRALLTKEALEFVRLLLNAPIQKIALENPIGCISTQIRKYDQKVQPWQFGDDASKGTCLWLKNLQPLQATTIIPPVGWSQVVFSSDLPPCEMCGEPWCTTHQEHYADCACIGPTQDEVTYTKIEGYLFGSLEPTPSKPVWANQTPSGQNKLGPSKDRAKIRSRTYKGIAKAMAQQWGTGNEM